MQDITGEPVDKYLDGYYRFFDGEASWIAGVRDGVMGDDPVESLIEEGYEVTPVIVMTPEEHDALNADRARLVARCEELEALIAYIDKRAPLADDTCAVPGLTLSEAAKRQMDEEAAGNE